MATAATVVEVMATEQMAATVMVPRHQHKADLVTCHRI